MLIGQLGHRVYAMKKERRWLINAIRNRLLPEFVRRGFKIVPISKGGLIDRELIYNSPFGTLRRPGSRGFELVEVQLITYGRAAFRILAGAAPPNGLETFNGHIAAEDILVGWLDESFEIYQYPLLWSCLPSLAYFSIKPWQKRASSQEDYDALAQWVASLIPEVELALRDGKCGPHVRLVKINHPRP